MTTDEQRAAKAAYDREYRARHRERKAENDRSYAERNREKVAAYQADYRTANRDKHREYHRAYHVANRDRHIDLGRKAYLKYKYGISQDEYDAMLLSQGGVCKVCFKKNTAGRRLAVDHDHETGAVRGLLCSPCNSALGLLNDDPEIINRASEYLSEFARSQRRDS